ncbi:hypothetical protein K7432_003384 [Basidiobolus ranarum]|uniref:Yeast cell wall synthesis Kre9/Knh1-like N-terminal domain-containing protein n=1 Tax=Basidiobolus ranarum TaxID=34480 RepID=A0ABR2WZZ3_9FUNG
MFSETLVKFASAALLLVTMVNGDVAITSPLMATWKEGSTQFITWTDNGVEPKMAATFDLYLMSGPPTALQPVAEIAKGVDSSKGQYEWAIPTTLKPGKDYAIRAGVGSSISYSPYFELSAGSGDSSPPKESPGKSGAASKSSGSPTGSATGSAGASPSASGSSGASKPSSSGAPTASASSAASRPSNQASSPAKPTTSPPTNTKLSDASRPVIFKILGLITVGVVYIWM